MFLIQLELKFQISYVRGVCACGRGRRRTSRLPPVLSPRPCPDCEHLIRRMLVLDPSKRLSVAQIKEHRWMALEVPMRRPLLYQQGSAAEEAGVGEYSEQVLRLMHSLGIDQHKTIEVRPLYVAAGGALGGCTGPV